MSLPAHPLRTSLILAALCSTPLLAMDVESYTEEARALLVSFLAGRLAMARDCSDDIIRCAKSYGALHDMGERLGPGDMFLVPPDKSHSIQLLTKHVRLVDCFSPIRADFLV